MRIGLKISDFSFPPFNFLEDVQIEVVNDIQHLVPSVSYTLPLLGVLLSAILVVVVRLLNSRELQENIETVTNDQLCRQNFRNKTSSTSTFSIALHAVFIINLSVVIQLLFPSIPILVHLAIIVFVYSIRFLLHRLSAYFVIDPDLVHFYMYCYLTICKIIGIVLIPLNLLLLFGTSEVQLTAAILVGLIAFLGLLVILIRLSRVLPLFSFYNILHIILYICTLEIAPALLLTKWMQVLLY